MTAISETEVVEQALLSMTGSEKPDKAVRAGLDVFRKSFAWTYTCFWRLDDRGHLIFGFEVGRVKGTKFRMASQKARLTSGQSLAGRAWETGKIEVVDTLEGYDDPRIGAAAQAGLAFAMAAPVVMDGATLGVIEMWHTSADVAQGQRTAFSLLASLLSQRFQRFEDLKVHREAAENARAVNLFAYAVSEVSGIEALVR